jgi:hypothetical protein
MSAFVRSRGSQPHKHAPSKRPPPSDRSALSANERLAQVRSLAQLVREEASYHDPALAAQGREGEPGKGETNSSS